ncbi:hypothetical protein SAMN06265222_10747 [Neorhodopirellula lusitana]|uniref:Uncharacterized protein n=1 Tax=Neorhodopirellula lusitana TaxID=445327 RepID=A0ABY1Q784_9BACT|nr:hypothetical protein SAMN06265222_10747 [Neorhodopirellula lusitana]
MLQHRNSPIASALTNKGLGRFRYVHPWVLPRLEIWQDGRIDDRHKVGTSTRVLEIANSHDYVDEPVNAIHPTGCPAMQPAPCDTQDGSTLRCSKPSD